MIVLDSDICTDFQAASSREWLETNGMGSFASGTVSGANTRRYHGIFTAATEPPLGRLTMLSKVEETLFIDQRPFELSANQYPGKIHPQGFQFLKTFRLDPFPIWTYEIDGIELEKKIFMPHGRNAVVCRWKVTRTNRRDARALSLEIRPLISFVDYHHLRREDPAFVTDYTNNSGVVTMRPSAEMPPIVFQHTPARIEKTGYWYHDFEYAIEQERGFDFREDLFQPFAMKFENFSGADLIVSTARSNSEAGKLEKSEIKRRKALVKLAKADD
ncbi:MAG TPA: glycogen debranching enzyme N-terminal domain-containing protein, partial [Pyrinomonadaceae bacterium]|nr:glycogen debranching enzyme N-terminal domain-containing protein [Pyrinomonadaceae bacterium]